MLVQRECDENHVYVVNYELWLVWYPPIILCWREWGPQTCYTYVRDIPFWFWMVVLPVLTAWNFDYEKRLGTLCRCSYKSRRRFTRARNNKRDNYDGQAPPCPRRGGGGKITNQELSGAKSELQGKMVGVCSFYKRSGQLPYNSALQSLQMCLLVHA